MITLITTLLLHFGIISPVDQGFIHAEQTTFRNNQVEQRVKQAPKQQQQKVQLCDIVQFDISGS